MSAAIFMVKIHKSVRCQCSVAIAILVLALTACSTPKQQAIMQVATIDALLAGVYDGHMSLSELRKYGDFGLGTFDRLDGEMILLDGTFFKVKGDGNVVLPPGTETTPFAAVTKFSPDLKRTLPAGLNWSGIEATVNRLFPNQNRFCAFRVDGTFRRIRVRSVPSQNKPYPPLLEVTQKQTEFVFEDIPGTLVGFRSPPFVKGMNVPGFHIHFLSKDRTRGGHVLDLDIAEGVLAIDRDIDWLEVYMPAESGDFARANLSKDRSRELESVER